MQTCSTCSLVSHFGRLLRGPKGPAAGAKRRHAAEGCEGERSESVVPEGTHQTYRVPATRHSTKMETRWTNYSSHKTAIMHYNALVQGGILSPLVHYQGRLFANLCQVQRWRSEQHFLLHMSCMYSSPHVLDNVLGSGHSHGRRHSR